MNDLDWGDLKIILALAQAGSVRRAAGLLDVHPSTVTRRIDAVERTLGTRLFRRQPSGLSPTLAGQELLQSAERVQQEVNRMERRLSGRDEKLEGPVRINVPDIVARSFLMSQMGTFIRENPSIELHVDTGNSTVDLGGGETDIAIWATNEPPENLVGRPLGHLASAAYATPEYLNKHDLRRHPERCRKLASTISSEMDEAFAEIPTAAWFNSLPLLHDAARQGLGIAQLPCAIADPDAELVRVPPGGTVAGEPLWLFTHPDLRGSARIRAVMDMISGAFRSNATLVSGEWAEAPQAA